MSRSLRGAGFGVWIAIIIIIAILAAYSGYYGGYYHGLSAGLQQSVPALPSNIKVGVVLSNIAYSDDIFWGTWLAAKIINNTGGVASRNLTLLFKYTGGDPGTAKSIITSLVDDGVRVFIGALSDIEVKTILPVLRESNAVLVLVSNETYDDVYDDPMVIKMLGGPDVEASAMVDLALEVGTRAAIIAVNDSYGVRLANSINRIYSSRGGVVVYESLYSEAANVTADLEKIKNMEDPPTVVFLVGYVDDAYTILVNASSIHLNTTWILSRTLAGEELLSQELAPYLEGSYVVVRSPPVRGPQMQDFMEVYVKTYNREPSEMAAYGFDVLRLIALSIAWAGHYDGPTIRKSIDIVIGSFVGATGRKILDSNGNAFQDYEILRLVKDNEAYKFKTVGYWTPISPSKAFISWTAEQ